MTRRYQLLYADPPWRFKTRSAKGKGRSAEAHYDCLDLDAIKALPVGAMAERDAVLLMWTTDPFLEEAFGVLRAWGFRYKTVGLYWAKLNPLNGLGLPRGSGDVLVNKDKDFAIGTGYHTRANVEPCLLATRGKGLKRVDAGVPKLIVSPRRLHSQKPDEAYDRLERLYGDVSRLELFARATRPGWDAWGSEVGRLDGGARPERRWRSDMRGAPTIP